MLWSKMTPFSIYFQVNLAVQRLQFNTFDFQWQKFLSPSWMLIQRTLASFFFLPVQTHCSALQFFNSCRNAEAKFSLMGSWPAVMSRVRKRSLLLCFCLWFYRSLIRRILLNPSLLAFIFKVLLWGYTSWKDLELTKIFVKNHFHHCDM